MNAALFCLLLAQQDAPAPSVHPFFPSENGAQWVYEEVNAGEKRRVTETLVVREGAPSFGIRVESEGQPPEMTFYRIEQDAVFITAYEAGKNLKRPVPILRFFDKPQEWKYSGPVEMMQTEATLELTGSSKPDRERKFDGKSVRTVRVELNASLLTLGGDRIRSKQTTWYGLGIGALRVESETFVQGVTIKATRELVSFKPGGSTRE